MARALRPDRPRDTSLDRLRDDSHEAWTTPAERVLTAELAPMHRFDPAVRKTLADLSPCSKLGIVYDADDLSSRAEPMSPDAAAWIVRDVLDGMVQSRRREAVRAEAGRRGVTASSLAQDVGLGWA